MRPRKESLRDFLPKARIEVPLAAWRKDAEEDPLSLCAGDAGKTDTSAPLSTRKDRRWKRQKTDSAPSWVEAEEREEMMCGVPGVTADSRPWSFPGPRVLVLGGEYFSSGRKKEPNTYRSPSRTWRGWRTRSSASWPAPDTKTRMPPQLESGGEVAGLKCRMPSHCPEGTTS